jgi:hypothetical protein
MPNCIVSYASRAREPYRPCDLTKESRVVPTFYKDLPSSYSVTTQKARIEQRFFLLLLL